MSCVSHHFSPHLKRKEKKLPRDDEVDTLLACVMRCRGLGDAMGEDNVEEVLECVAGNATKL